MAEQTPHKRLGYEPNRSWSLRRKPSFLEMVKVGSGATVVQPVWKQWTQ